MAGRGCSSVLASICYNRLIHDTPSASRYLVIAGIESVSNNNCFEDEYKYLLCIRSL